jgi:iron complex transport system permease protein
VDAPSPKALAIYASVTLPLMAWIIWKSPDWDLLSMGEAWAASRGVPVRRLLLEACIAGSILIAATVSLTGPIGFVGLIVPHMVRHFAGASHRRVLPAAFFSGAAFLMCCDAIARTVLRPAEIPVGVITALIGGPGLIWILRGSRSEV